MRNRCSLAAINGTVDSYGLQWVAVTSPAVTAVAQMCTAVLDFG